ncbi:very short patch repair endonuclease [Pseudomonas citronellolis]|uniref:very short patch repair endonuclease n=2 Tax=Pseudomonas aeruginosa group TaxID=136841 RepID=UPI0026498C55|nr:very short patch repair endonuclease [Pseudomonas citronellolis]MDN6873689.1 very short patch repair endonuclease [Pseudomonas citronellolis]
MWRLQTIPRIHNRNSSPSTEAPQTVDPVALRSANMARIRGRNTTPEMQLRKALWREGLRYRVQLRVEGTRPDIVFTSCRLAVFVDGCFWHGCPQHYVMPRSKMEFWSTKLATNTNRDRIQTRRLISNGWRILRFWEHEVETEPERVVAEIIAAYREPAIPFRDRRMVVHVEPANPDGTQELWMIESLLESEEGSQELRSRKPRR